MACSLKVKNRSSGEPSRKACCIALYTAIGTSIIVAMVIISTFFSHTDHLGFLYEGVNIKPNIDDVVNVSTHTVKHIMNC